MSELPILVSDQLTNGDLFWSGMEVHFLRIIKSSEINKFSGHKLFYDTKRDDYNATIKMHILQIQSQHHRGRIVYQFDSYGDCSSCGGILEAKFDEGQQKFTTRCWQCQTEN